MNARTFLGWLLALVFLVVSGIQVAFSTESVRERHKTLQSLQAELDAAAEEYSRLQIELAAVAAYQNVERTAEDKLGMSFPEEVQRVEP
ncbi:MAG: cell division protein FtsL [Pseudomonadales bacterium]